MTKVRDVRAAAAADADLIARHQGRGSADLDGEVRKRFQVWQVTKDKVAEYRSALDQAKRVAASPPADVGQLDHWRAGWQRAERLLAEGPVVLPALEAAATAAGLAWSSSWTDWAARLRAEVVDPVVRERERTLQRLDQRLSEAQAELSRRLSEMPAA